MICSRCKSTEFRLSTVKFRDLEHLAIFQYPVRCRSCHHRTYGSFLLALVLLQMRRYRHSGASAE